MNMTVTPSMIPAALAVILDANKGKPANEQLVPFLKSAPGLGKSSICAAFASTRGLSFHDTRLAYAAPTDVRGFPFVTGKAGSSTMSFATPRDYPTTPGNLWLLDEFTCAPRTTQIAGLQLILDKRVGDYVVPDDTLLVLAGNRAIDRAHVERLSSAVVNRIVQITVVPDLDEWCNWAATKGLDPRVIAYVRFRPDQLSNFEASKWDGDDGFTSPRSWNMVSTLLQAQSWESAPFVLQQSLVHGAIGTAAGTEFCAFLDTYRKLPDIDKMLKNPAKAEISDEPSIQWAIVAALVPRAKGDNIEPVLELAARLPKEFEVMLMRMLLKGPDSKDIRKHPALVKWIVDPANMSVFNDGEF